MCNQVEEAIIEVVAEENNVTRENEKGDKVIPKIEEIIKIVQEKKVSKVLKDQNLSDSKKDTR